MKWTDVEDIVELLEENHPEIDVYSLRFTHLHKLVRELEGFNDEHYRSNEKILEAIQGAWIEVRQDKL